MYTVDWAKNFTGFTKEEPMNLRDFAHFYAANIAGKRYIYETNHKSIPSFTIVSEESQLPHLMGLQHWQNLSTKQATNQFQHMFDDDWDLDMLKSADAGAWQEHRERLEFTPHLYNLLHTCNCTVKLVNQQARDSTFVRRNIHLFFQKNEGKLGFAVELREIPGEDIYRPVSIKVIRPGDRVLREPHGVIKITSITIDEL